MISLVACANVQHNINYRLLYILRRTTLHTSAEATLPRCLNLLKPLIKEYVSIDNFRCWQYTLEPLNLDAPKAPWMRLQKAGEL